VRENTITQSFAQNCVKSKAWAVENTGSTMGAREAQFVTGVVLLLISQADGG